MSAPFVIHIRREWPAWLVIAGSYGWLHGSFHAALSEARELARGFGTLVVMERGT
jgi:hypothetical protein